MSSDISSPNTYSFKYLYPYPFIKHNSKYHLPLPHLLIEAITDSLLTRLTVGNDSLRQLLGKEVIENYLYDILQESNAYDEVVRECKYYIKKTPIFSPDVMVYKNDRCILFDTKASVPPIKLREFDESTFSKLIDRYARTIKNVYNRICEFGIYYKPFNRIGGFDKKNIFGVVVLLEDNFILRQNIYDRAAELLELEVPSSEFEYIQSNIKIVSLKDIEYKTFMSKDYSENLIYNRDHKHNWYDFAMNTEDINEDENDLKRIESLDRFISFCKALETSLAKN